MLNLSAHLMQFQVIIFHKNCLRFRVQKYGIMCEIFNYLQESCTMPQCVFASLEAVFFFVFSCSYMVAHSGGHRTDIELIFMFSTHDRKDRNSKISFLISQSLTIIFFYSFFLELSSQKFCLHKLDREDDNYSVSPENITVLNKIKILSLRKPE